MRNWITVMIKVNKSNTHFEIHKFDAKHTFNLLRYKTNN